MTRCGVCGFELNPEGGCPRCQRDNVDSSGLAGSILIGKYLVESVLGTGGMCHVYRARHIETDREVAIKVLRAEVAADPGTVERFQQEALAASRIEHPHAVFVTDSGRTETDLPVIVMELVRGATLGDILRDSAPMPIERASEILGQICSALDAAHAVGVVHRDIKPDNIIVSEVDGRDWVKVVDFGIARILEGSEERSRLTAPNLLVGTPRYMSPEQCLEEKIDHRSDIYSLGVVLYEVLAGDAPFDEDSSTQLLIAHASRLPVPLSSRRPDLPAAVESVVMRALEKDPDRRPRSAGELHREFEAALNADDVVRISVPLGGSQAGAMSSFESMSSSTESSRVARRVGHRLFAIAALTILGVIGAIALTGGGLFVGSRPVTVLIDSQRSITEAVARIDSLPGDHPLREHLPLLAEWLGELRAYQQLGDGSEETVRRAQEYRSRAEQLGNEARAANASLLKEGKSGGNPTGVPRAGEPDKSDKDSVPKEKQDKNSPPAVQPIDPGVIPPDPDRRTRPNGKLMARVTSERLA